ncbi:energy transducer TonB [Gymnodinialimonas sp. 2305UL16-5]|uniref:energy transducer TonB n=1 Tax=Gymnodinialimonas mytili TaxID=3126503 RepID=UPI0030A1B8C9
MPMNRSLYASGGLHALLLAWVAFGGMLFERSPDVEFEVTGVTIMSAEEFEDMTGTAAVSAPSDVSTLPNAPALDTSPEAPTAEAPPPPTDAPQETAAPPPETTPVPVEQVPDTIVSDDVAVLAPPPGAPDAEVSPTPTPDEAPRIAPIAAPLPEPDAEVAPEVLEQPSEPDISETPQEETPETAPEEATTEIVTEAEEPAAAPLGPTASLRPAPRPARSAPVEEPVEQAEAAPESEPEPADPVDPLADAINQTIAEVVEDDAPAPTPAPAPAPSGPPLSQGARDGFRVAVQSCWNVGALSTEALGTTVVIAFDMARDGRPDAGSIQMIEFSNGSDAAARQAFEAARRAVIRCGVNGYDLPAESYDRWAQVELVFNPEGMRLR